MVISFANQKGGVGKSTHCALFAQYLCDKEMKVHVIDMDYQMSLVNKRKNDESFSLLEMREQDTAMFDNSLNYTIEAVTPIEIINYLKQIESDKESVYIIDTPGSLSNQNVIKTLYKSDFIIIPFDYSELKLDSTAVFIQLIKKFRIPAKLIFLPNDIDRRYRENRPEAVDKINNILGEHGVIAPAVYHLADIKRFSTLEITARQKEIILSTYDFIFQFVFG
jgi:chromosome partitioning protein